MVTFKDDRMGLVADPSTRHLLFRKEYPGVVQVECCAESEHGGATQPR